MALQRYQRPTSLINMGDNGHVRFHSAKVVSFDVPHGGNGGHDGGCWYAGVRANRPIPPHKAYYLEVKILAQGQYGGSIGVGVCSGDTAVGDIQVPPTEFRTDKSLRYLYHGSGTVQKSGRDLATCAPFGTGDIIGCHVDVSKGAAYFRKNGRRIGLAGAAGPRGGGASGGEVVPVAGRLFPFVVFASPGCAVEIRLDDGVTACVYDREEIPREGV